MIPRLGTKIKFPLTNYFKKCRKSSFENCTVLYCTVLYCTVLYCLKTKRKHLPIYLVGSEQFKFSDFLILTYSLL